MHSGHAWSLRQAMLLRQGAMGHATEHASAVGDLMLPVTLCDNRQAAHRAALMAVSTQVTSCW